MSEYYEFRVKGQLSPDWYDWWEGFQVTVEGGETVLYGPVVDEAALYGILDRMRDLGLSLLALNRRRADAANTKEEQTLCAP